MVVGTDDSKNVASVSVSELSSSIWADVFRRLVKNKTAVFCFFVFVIIALACAMAPILTTYDYARINPSRNLEKSSFEHILGTDNLGRDLFTRLLYGGRMTLRIAFVSTAIAAVAGSIIGVVAGFFSGWADFIISPVLDTIASIPVMLLAVVAETIFGWGLGSFMYAIAVAAIPHFARLVRATVMNIMGSEYIEAARALGVSNAGIIVKHVIHNIAPPLIIRFTSGLSEALLTCTIMGYLTIGVSPPTPEWGYIVFMASRYVRSHPRLIIIPCLVIITCVISINLFGDGLRDALDPRD